MDADHMHAGWVVPPPVIYVLPFASILFPRLLFVLHFFSSRRVSFSFFIAPFSSPHHFRQYYYYYLTVEGIDYLRQYLNLPQDVVPQTHSKKEGRPARPAGFAERGDRPEGERERRPFDKEKRLGPDGSFAPSFGGGGFGRGGGGNREGGYRG